MRHPRAARALLAVVAGLGLAVNVTAGPLDADDRAKVEEIDDEVSDQIDRLNDTTIAMDGLVNQAEAALTEVEFLAAYNAAQLRLDIEQMLLASCAPACAAEPLAPLPAAAPASASSAGANCWLCANPRLMIANQHGGYLEDVIALVGNDIQAIIDVGLSLDVDTAAELMTQASEAFDAGAGQEAFSLSCKAFSTLACGAAPPALIDSLGPSVAPTRTRGGFAGFGQRVREEETR